MGRRQKQAIITDNCAHRINRRSRMHGNMFTDHAVAANFQNRFLTGKARVLRRAS